MEVSEARILTWVAINSARNTIAEYPRVPAQGYSAQGKPAPKARAKAVADGNQINISGPASSDEYQILYFLIGLKMQWRYSRK